MYGKPLSGKHRDRLITIDTSIKEIQKMYTIQAHIDQQSSQPYKISSNVARLHTTLSLTAGYYVYRRRAKFGSSMPYPKGEFFCRTCEVSRCVEFASMWRTSRFVSLSIYTTLNQC